MKSERLRIYIPEKSAPALLISLKQYLDPREKDIIYHERWKKIIKDIEASSPKTIDTFVENFLSTSNVEYQNQRIVTLVMCTALTQSLFDQFSHEKCIYYCAKFLRDAIQDDVKVDWKQIDLKNFNTRVKQAWGAFPRLIGIKKLHGTSLLRRLGLSINDFTQSFFSSGKIEAVINTLEIPVAADFERCPTEIKAAIFSYLNMNALYSLRYVSRSAYYTIESNTELRMKHRLYLYTTSVLLQAWIGKKIYHGNGYLLTEPTYSLSETRCHVISMKSPYECLQHDSIQMDGYSEMIGGYVFIDAEKKLNILTAYYSRLYGNLFSTAAVKVDTNTALMNTSTAKIIKVMHDDMQDDTNGNLKWHRAVKIKIKSDKVNIDATFTMLQRGWDEYNGYHEFFVRGLFLPRVRYSAECTLADFGSDREEIVAVKKI